MLIGHCRYATQGDYSNNLNNHPHPSDGGWMVHNGVVPNYLGLIDRHELQPVSDCDTEVLALLIESLNGTLIERCIGAVQAIGRGSPAVVCGLWKPGRLVLVRRGNPLMLGSAETGYYFASLADGMPRNRHEVRDGSAVELAIKGGDVVTKERGFDDGQASEKTQCQETQGRCFGRAVDGRIVARRRSTSLFD